MPELRAMVRMYTTEGAALQDVADAMGRSIGTVHRQLRAAGVEMRPSGVTVRPHPCSLSAGELRRTAQLYESGRSLREVAEELGVTESVVRYRLDRVGMPRRSRAETARQTGHLVRLEQHVEDEIVRLYVADLRSQREVAEEVGVDLTTVRRALRRRGVRVRDRAQAARVWRGLPPGDPAPCVLRFKAESASYPEDREAKVLRRYVPAAPLVRLVRAAAARDAELGQDGAATGVSDRLLYAWRVGERRFATWDRADGVLIALGRFWWEVYDPADARPCETFSGVRGRDVVAWVKAAEMAAALWEPAAGVGERVSLEGAVWRIESWDSRRGQFWLCRADGHRQAFAPSRLEGL